MNNNIALIRSIIKSVRINKLLIKRKVSVAYKIVDLISLATKRRPDYKSYTHDILVARKEPIAAYDRLIRLKFKLGNLAISVGSTCFNHSTALKFERYSCYPETSSTYLYLYDFVIIRDFLEIVKNVGSKLRRSSISEDHL